jgi:hypothetical protein
MLPVRIQNPALNACWQAVEVLADGGPLVVSAVMASVWCNGILKVPSRVERWAGPCLNWAA